MKEIIIAIDPGRKRCGLVVLALEGDLLEKRTLTTADFSAELSNLLLKYQPVKVLLGKGTYSRVIKEKLKAILGEAQLEMRDESFSSEKARSRYFIYYPPRGINKLIPRGLRVPGEPYDDFAALILAEEYLKEKRQGKKGEKK